MLETIFSILVFVFVLGLVIIIHELGHFIFAKRAGILCHEFSLGMGPILWSKKIGETTYLIKAIPIGGYVMMAGEEISHDVVKVGEYVRVELKGNTVKRIILDKDNKKYENYDLVLVDRIDVYGENGNSLYLNNYTVARDCLYVYKDRELQLAPYERCFESKSKLDRFLTIFAGPFMNFVLAFFVYIFISFIIGFPNVNHTVLGEVADNTPAHEVLEENDEISNIEGHEVENWDDIKNELNRNVGNRHVDMTIYRDDAIQNVTITPIIHFYSIGFHSSETAVDDVIIGEVYKNTKAYKAGFIEGDKIVKAEIIIDEEVVDSVNVNSWQDLIDIVSSNNAGELMKFTVLRNDETKDIKVEPYNEDLVQSQGLDLVGTQIGISPTYSPNFLKSLTAGFSGIRDSSKMIFETIRLLTSNDQVGVGDLAGPIGIYQITSSALSQGLLSLFGWIALLSVNLGIINLLPIPALDGGRLVFLGYEAITKRKPNKKIENALHYGVFIAFMALFIYISFNDILRLFNLK